ncbi:hypothetical protein LIER_06402 [Lithospermum erythrorhizon]|uniref:Uncharacterized protein n=1 Tax=Lithospermum erythrorhizon TaxID=34254 RepID=A0AAV3P5G9_LITER
MIPIEVSSTAPSTNIIPEPTINPLYWQQKPLPLFILPPKNLKRLRRRKCWLAILLRGKAVCEDVGEVSAPKVRLSKYTCLYLRTPYEVPPNVEVNDDSPWGARKFHFHLARPFLSKKMAAWYIPLVDPYAAFAQAMKHMTQAINGSYILARRSDHLAVETNSLNNKLKAM